MIVDEAGALGRHVERAVESATGDFMEPAAAEQNDEKVNPLTLDVLRESVESAAALRCRRKFQPAGGPGDKVFPPTFAGAVYAMEERRLAERDALISCVLLDSVQSQVNRMEAALQLAIDSGKLRMPLLVVDFSESDPTDDAEADENAGRFLDAVGNITSLQVPHRLADAILRDSTYNNIPFRKSEIGKVLNRMSTTNATSLFQYCPTALLFGMWDSTGPKGGLGAKFERAIVSEIVGIGSALGDLRRGIRRDPLEISKSVRVVRNADRSLDRVAKSNEKGAVRPSEINHSSVPFPKQSDKKTDKNVYDGVTIDFAEQTTTLSLIVLRRLCFPAEGRAKPNSDRAARLVLAALGLCAATLAFEEGIALRSRCLLWPESPMTWEILAKPGLPPEKVSLAGAEALQLVVAAVNEAREAGITWKDDPIRLKPSKELLNLVRLSQIEAVAKGADEE